MKKTRVELWISFLIYGSLLAPLSSAQGITNKRQIVSQAREAYYNLTKEGLAEFQCSLVPNWEAVLADQRKSDPAAADAGLKVLEQIRFSAKFGQNGKLELTHNDVPAKNAEMAKALNQIFSGMEEMTSGFFETWKVFMLNPPFPAVDSEYQLETLGPGFRLTYKEGAANVVTTMDRDLAMSNLRITTPEFDSTIQPRFTKTSKGFLFSGYDASYQSKKPEEATQLKALIGYQAIDGLQILQKLNLSGSYGGSPFAMEVTFSDCKVAKKPARK